MVLEQQFTLEEALPAGSEDGKILYYLADCTVNEKKIMADKLIFRGVLHLHVLSRTTEEVLCATEHDFPFSQYTELEHTFSTEAQVDITPVLTTMELQREENGALTLKAGVLGQYVIYDTKTVTLITDAYSTCRAVQPQHSGWSMPSVLDRQQISVALQAAGESACAKQVDTALRMAHPGWQVTAEGFSLTCSGTFQLLGYDENGMLICENLPFTQEYAIAAENGVQVAAACVGANRPNANLTPDGVQIQGECAVRVLTETTSGLEMVTGLELGEAVRPDPERPSLILRRCSDGDLWQIAKQTGSTVEAIREANGLQEEWPQTKVLLIPVP